MLDIMNKIYNLKYEYFIIKKIINIEYINCNKCPYGYENCNYKNNDYKS